MENHNGQGAVALDGMGVRMIDHVKLVVRIVVIVGAVKAAVGDAIWFSNGRSVHIERLERPKPRGCAAASAAAARSRRRTYNAVSAAITNTLIRDVVVIVVIGDCRAAVGQHSHHSQPNLTRNALDW
jgi:hypothetical protein